MSRAERFEDLRIWQQARVMVRAINAATRELRDFGFRDQLRAQLARLWPRRTRP